MRLAITACALIVAVSTPATAQHQWDQTFGSLNADLAAGVSVDAANNIYLTGQFRGSVDFGGGSLVAQGDGDVFLAKFNSSGTHQWSKRIGSSDTDRAIAIDVDAGGNVTITGTFEGTVDFGGGPIVSAAQYNDGFVARYDASGNHLWSRGFAATTLMQPLGVGSDASGNVVVTGHFFDSANFGAGAVTSAGQDDLFIAVYDSNGNPSWSHVTGSNLNEESSAVAVTSAGDAVIIGLFEGQIDFGAGPFVNVRPQDGFVVRYDPLGNVSWQKIITPVSAAGARTLYDVAVDAAGNAYVAGSMWGTFDFGGGNLTSTGFDGSLSPTDAFVVTYDAAGNHVWSALYGGTKADRAVAVDVSAGGDLAVAGTFSGEAKFGGVLHSSHGMNDIFIARFSAAGAHVWSRTIGSPLWQEQVSSIILDGAGNTLISASFDPSMSFGGGVRTSQGDFDAVVAKYGDVLTGIGPLPDERESALAVYPNPFNPATSITYSLDRAGTVSLRVYDVSGRLVDVVIDSEHRPAGSHRVHYEPDLSTGIYFVRLVSGGSQHVARIVLLK